MVRETKVEGIPEHIPILCIQKNPEDLFRSVGTSMLFLGGFLASRITTWMECRTNRQGTKRSARRGRGAHANRSEGAQADREQVDEREGKGGGKVVEIPIPDIPLPNPADFKE